MRGGSAFQMDNSCKLYERNWLGNRQAAFYSCLLLGVRKSAAGNFERAATLIKIGAPVLLETKISLL